MQRRLPTLLMVSAALAAVLAASGCSSDAGRIAANEQQSANEPQTVAPTADSEPPEGAKPLLENPGFSAIRGFRTDTSRATISADEVLSGGPPKDGIPAIDEPKFVPLQDALTWLGPYEPVFVVSADGETRIYPVQILTYHEIVNDVVGQTPLTVTFCPLCNTGVAFRREFRGQVLDFGTTGRLRFSNLLMYDRQSETWWQQATGDAVLGEFAGYRLDLYPMLMIPWERARERFPDALVLSRETGFARPYGNNPYAGYDSSPRPFLYSGPRTPGPFAPMDRVLEVVEGTESVAIPYPVLESERVVQRDVGGTSIVVFWQRGTASALDSRSIAEGRDVGSANAFLATTDDRTLTFEPDGNVFRDLETGSTWDFTGRAVAGELVGTRLEPAVGIQHFWFSHSAFAADGRWTPLE